MKPILLIINNYKDMINLLAVGLGNECRLKNEIMENGDQKFFIGRGSEVVWHLQESIPPLLAKRRVGNAN